jgi:hypothetical protein
MPEQIGDIDLRAANSIYVDDEGVIYQDSANIGSGTGGYNTFLALSGNDGNIAGFNSDDEGAVEPSNPDQDLSKSETVLLASVPITTINGVQYYEIRVDLNEANSNPDGQISLDGFQLYASGSSTIQTLGDLTNPMMAKLIYDLDAGGDKSLLLSEVSTGSGTDDYSIFIPVTLFGDANPATTYLYVNAALGYEGGDYVENSGFEEFNIQNAVTLKGTKFNDLDSDGFRDENEQGVGGVTVFIDSDKYGILDAHRLDRPRKVRFR